MDIFAPFVAPAAAQQLIRLHVRQFEMSADPVSLRIGETLRLKIVTRVDENLVELDEVTLPDLSGFESLGDERQCSTAYHGSRCTETITLTPTVAGDRTIAGATLEAIDANSGRAVRFSSNSVVVHVAGAPLPNYFWQGLLEGLIRPFAILLLVAALGYAALWGWRRRPKPVVAEPPASPAPPPVPAQAAPAAPPALHGLVETLVRAPSRANLLAVRAELRRRIGAREEETLADLRARGATRGDADLDAALRATEFAAFADDARLDGAITRALEPLQRLVSPPAGAMT
jgi:hypothetical protein